MYLRELTVLPSDASCRGRLKLHSLLDYLQDNEFIYGRYRYEQSVRDALHSVFAGHNKILNVWK